MKTTIRRMTASGSSFDSISQLKKDLNEYWESLPSETYCRDLTPSHPLFRFNIHLALTYHLVHIFIGRTFIFGSPSRSATNTPNSILERVRPASSEVRRDLVATCVQSSLSVIDLCQKLQDNGGLARASYTEFTTCRAALFVIIAQRMHERSSSLRKASEQGLRLIKSMSLGIYGARAEKLAIEAMETALRRLDERVTSQKQKLSEQGSSSNSAYDQFRNWAMLWRNNPGDLTNSIGSCSNAPSTNLPISFDAADFANLEPLQTLGWDLYSPSFPFEFGDFTQSLGSFGTEDTSAL
jgi:hypothetical protein